MPCNWRNAFINESHRTNATAPSNLISDAYLGFVIWCLFASCPPNRTFAKGTFKNLVVVRGGVFGSWTLDLGS